MEYFKNGKLWSEYQIDKDGKANGYYKNYYESGQLEFFTYYIDNKRNGRYTGYYSDGKVENSGYDVDGEYQGDDTVFYENGKIEAISYYNRGKENGPKIFYNPKGDLDEYDLMRNDTLMYQLKYDSLLSDFKEWWKLWIIPKSDSIKLSSEYEAKISFYNQDKFEKIIIHTRISSEQDYYSGAAFRGRDDLTRENFHNDYRIEYFPKKSGKYILWGDFTMYDKNGIHLNSFEHRFVVYQ